MNCSSLVALLVAVALVASCGCIGSGAESQDGGGRPAPAPTGSAAPAAETGTPAAEPSPVPAPAPPDPYPDALNLKETFNYSSGKTASQGTVYRYWLNDTYQIFDPRETRYATKSPAAGNRYLIIFVNTVNRGTSRSLPVSPGNVVVHVNGLTLYPDPTHTLPRTAENADSPPEIFRIGEIEFFHTLYGSEYVGDFGYSHGMELAYLTPGESNAIDGYIVYEVPAALEPEETYVEIAFNSQDVAVWKLA